MHFVHGRTRTWISWVTNAVQLFTFSYGCGPFSVAEKYLLFPGKAGTPLIMKDADYYADARTASPHDRRYLSRRRMPPAGRLR